MADHSVLSLKILEAYTRDVGRGIARIDYDSMDAIGASTGNVIEIMGKMKTVGKCLPLSPSEEHKGIIRIDGLVRRNAAVTIGDAVIIQKVRVFPAEKVIVVPFDIIPPMDERYLVDALESIPLIKGDSLMVPYFGGRLEFRVTDTIPAAVPVLVSQKTEFEITGGTAVSEESVRDIRLRIEYGIRSEANKTFLRLKFILSHFRAEQVGEFEKELEEDQLQQMFEKYRNTAEKVLEDTKEELTKKLREQNSIEVKLDDIVCAILDRCQSIKH